MTRGIIIHREYGPVGTASASTFDPYRWPDGQRYVDVLAQEGVLPFPVDEADDDEKARANPPPSYWQAAARWALMSKYGVLFGKSSDDRTAGASVVLREIAYKAMGAKRRLVLSEGAVREITSRWREVVDEALAADSSSASSSADTTSIPEDMLEFVRTGLSHGREMQWTILECPAGLQFPVHAHPNFELVYNLRGDLHEVRMRGEPLPMDLPPSPPPTPASESTANAAAVVKGPSLTGISRPWFYGTTREGEWLVNEVGSVHKTFTASRGDGCLLLVVWGGSNANVDAADEPRTPNVQAAVDRMDERLCSCGADSYEEIQETFLPESERSAT